MMVPSLLLLLLFLFDLFVFCTRLLDTGVPSSLELNLMDEL